MKRTYTLNRIPSYRFNIDLPTGMSRFFSTEHCGKAEYYISGTWAGWDNIYYEKEPNYLDSIDKFFRFLNYPRYLSRADLDRLDALNKSPLGRKLIDDLACLSFTFYDCEPNSDRLYFTEYGAYFKLTPCYMVDPNTAQRYINSYHYEVYRNADYHEDKYITAREGLDCFILLQLSFLAIILNCKEESGADVREFSGRYCYKENLIDICIKNKLVNLI